MRLLIQRVKEAHVSVNENVCGKIGPGLLVFLGIHKDDTASKTDWLVKKLVGLRIFRDEEDKMNRDIKQTRGDILVVSQFTLYGTVDKGRRPEFTEAALPEPAFLLYEQFVRELNKALGREVQTGIFGAIMEVSLINDGPITLLLER
ncbi:MAG: D-tyrosyl-tRNA(Tyr) deacylase [Chlamydiales bacterium]|nr:D-tyrosyl-tRNA(Tyr) deacylase [Chlamydiales bacterium]